MGVNDELTAYLAKRVAVVSVLVRLHFLKELIDFVVVGFQQFESIRLTGLI